MANYRLHLCDARCPGPCVSALFAKSAVLPRDTGGRVRPNLSREVIADLFLTRAFLPVLTPQTRMSVLPSRPQNETPKSNSGLRHHGQDARATRRKNINKPLFAQSPIYAAYIRKDGRYCPFSHGRRNVNLHKPPALAHNLHWRRLVCDFAGLASYV